jgi:hypothetical protein
MPIYVSSYMPIYVSYYTAGVRCAVAFNNMAALCTDSGRPEATSVFGLKLLVYAALSY